MSTSFYALFSILRAERIPSETTLAMLLPAFRFSLPKEQEIVWRFGPTLTPSVKGGTSLHPRMPLLLEVI